jgi:hypothetical protein
MFHTRTPTRLCQRLQAVCVRLLTASKVSGVTAEPASLPLPECRKADLMVCFAICSGPPEVFCLWFKAICAEAGKIPSDRAETAVARLNKSGSVGAIVLEGMLDTNLSDAIRGQECIARGRDIFGERQFIFIFA